MVRLDNETFLLELGKLFYKATKGKSISFVMKRYDGQCTHVPKMKGTQYKPEPAEYMCLLRVKLGNKKISTVVVPNNVNKFQLAYCNLLRANLDGLKKYKKSKQKSKATQ